MNIDFYLYKNEYDNVLIWDEYLYYIRYFDYRLNKGTT